MSTILSGLSGVVCHTDDVLVYGRSREEHDQNLRNALKRIEKAGLTQPDLHSCDTSLDYPNAHSPNV